MQPYQVVKEPTCVWNIKLHTTTVFSFLEKERAQTICDILNQAFKSGYDVGFEVGFDSGRRSAI